LQLYTVRDNCARDFAGALAATAELGFEGVELYDLHGLEPRAVRALLDRHGLEACGVHAGLELVDEELERLAPALVALGTDRLVVNWIEPPRTVTDAEVVCERLRLLGQRAGRLGLRLGFHNHAGELAQLADGRTFLDHLLELDGPTLFLELDLGWVWYAGADPITLLERAGGRAPLVHVKDMRRDEEPVFVPLGDGSVDYDRLAQAAGRAGVEWLIVEQDETEGQAFAAVERSLAALRELLGNPAVAAAGEGRA
jgi:sugar phosphate isomerase/epimerase